MRVDEVEVTRIILESFAGDFSRLAEVDVAIAGAGPAGLTAARYLAKAGFKVAVFERNLHVGGGMWGGGMMFPRIVVEEEAKQMLEEVGIRLASAGNGYYVADSVEAVSKCTAAAIDAGAAVWVGMVVEDVMIRKEGGGYRVCGVVVNWHAAERAGLHVDPMSVRSRVVIDATGHGCEVVRRLVEKLPGARLPTPGGKVVGEAPMWAEVGEKEVVENTREVFPGLVVAGMAASAVFGSPRMGPVFGGMFLSGRRAAEIAARLLGKSV